jgi:putative DNA methylase
VTNSDDRRLIEEFLPVRAISYESTREKLLRRRDFHISMLHYWWARRPLAAARAAVYATLIPAGKLADDPEALCRKFEALCRWGGDMGVQNSAIEEARKEVLEANGGKPPKVLDCFAGGGAIALEAARLGAQAYAVELNPVAYLIDLCTLVYPQTYGPSLADDIEKWGKWLVKRAREELADLYPSPSMDGDAATLDGIGGASPIPVAYLWTRTVPCPNPALEPHDLHLVRQTLLRQKDGKYAALRPVVDPKRLTVEYEVVEAAAKDGLGFDPAPESKRGSSTCRVCGATVTADDVKIEGKAGRIGRKLMGVGYIVGGKRGKYYVGSVEAAAFVPADAVIDDRLERVVAAGVVDIPGNRLPDNDSMNFKVPLYGMGTVGALFTNRQLVTLLTSCRLVQEAHREMIEERIAPERAKAIATYLGMAVDRVADRCSTLCRWDNSAEKTSNTFSKQALPMIWDYSETNPFSGSSGDLSEALVGVAKVARHCAAAGDPAVVVRQSATDPVAGGPFDAVITDPPYYDNISYSDLSDYFYAWLQQSIGPLYPEHLSGPATPKRKEAVAARYRHDGDRDKAMQAYDDMMAEAFARRREELKPGAPLVVVYAHQTYAGWATLINALRRAGFVIVEAWPLDTEMPTRALGQNAASLASSIFLAARRRETEEVGEWVNDVQPELQRIVAERVAELPEMGVAGDDLVIATIGAGLRAYTAYSKVELPNGEPLTPEQYLEEVQREVVEAVLAEVFGLARSGISLVDPITRFYVMGRFEFGTSWVDYDKANTLARGVGVELGGSGGLLDGRMALLEKDKGKVRLRDYTKRGRFEKLADAGERNGRIPLIDVLQRMLAVAPSQPREVRGVVAGSGADPAQLRLVAQALTGETLDRKGSGTTGAELSAIASLLASWKRLVESPSTDQLELS